jgi:ParB family transcriptional regulator, chromosome partitioning protein
MSRKGLLAGLIDSKLPAGNSEGQSAPGDVLRPTPSPLPGFGGGGAIGAVSRSIEHIKSQAIIELDPALVEASLISDRLPSSPEAHADLVSSIREHGQHVPILVRPHPEKPGRYQIAYGRRRLKAVAELGRKVRALVKPLSDQELVVAQGQENSARTDLSFIEKALFASRLEEGGYNREIIMAALSVDKTGLSRLISSAVKIPSDIIDAVGPAPKAGRDRWIALATRLDGKGALGRARAAIADASFNTKSSDDRFNVIFVAAINASTPASASTMVKSVDGKLIATLKEDERGVFLSIANKDASGFGKYLAGVMPEIYEAFLRRVDQRAG